MQQTTSSTKINYAEVGEAISHELAAKMVKDYNDANPKEQYCFSIGRNVLEQILAQPQCAGLRIYNAINEIGKKTLVYAGIDNEGHTILNYGEVDKNGKLGQVEALIGDRLLPGLDWL